jgi:hypothetical protein
LRRLALAAGCALLVAVLAGCGGGGGRGSAGSKDLSVGDVQKAFADAGLPLKAAPAFDDARVPLCLRGHVATALDAIGPGSRFQPSTGMRAPDFLFVLVGSKNDHKDVGASCDDPKTTRGERPPTVRKHANVVAIYWVEDLGAVRRVAQALNALGIETVV